MAYESKKLKINLLAEMQTQSARSNQVEACFRALVFLKLVAIALHLLPCLHAFILL